MKTVFLLSTCMMIASILTAQITVDADPVEWTGTAPTVDNTSLITTATAGTTTKHNEWIWKDAVGDHRTDDFGSFVNADGQDITEIRLASDGTNLFALIKISNIDKADENGSPGIMISIDTDKDGTGTDFLGANSDAKTSAGALWEHLVISETGSGGNCLVWTEGFGSSSSVGASQASTINNVIELSIPWTAIGGIPTSGESYNFTFSVIRLNTSNEAFDIVGDNTRGDVLDFATTTTGNTYGALIGFNNGGNGDGGQLDDFQTIPFFEVGGIIELPVELTKFNSTVGNKDILLDWQTASESNNSHFEIEKSKDGNRFEKIGTVEGKGSTTERQDYTFTDKNPTVGLNYYRLKQVDFDGEFEYSKISVTAFERQKEITFFPNPTSTELIIEGTWEGEVDILIYNLRGQLIKEISRSLAEGYILVNVNDLAKGTYHVQLIDRQSGNPVHNYRMIKQ